MKFATFNTDLSGGFTEFEVIDRDESEPIAYMKSVVGGYLESIYLSSMGATMWINEEGKLLGLPFNPLGTVFWEEEFGKTDIIVGNVVLTGFPDAEGYLTGLPEGFAAMLAKCMHEPEDCPQKEEE